MASFRTHISFGIALGFMSVLVLVGFALVPTSWNFYLLTALVVIIGAILPDMDSDSGLPFHVTFGSLAIIAGCLAFLYALQTVPGDYPLLALYSLGAILFVWVVIGTLFKKFTRHRGMAHSIPAAVLSGLLTFSLAARTGFDGWQAFLLGVSLTLGYLLHLVLDEICAGVNFHGHLFVPNKAFGSALKFFSQSKQVNVAVYGAIVFILLGNGPLLVDYTQRLLGSI